MFLLMRSINMLNVLTLASFAFSNKTLGLAALTQLQCVVLLHGAAD